MTALVFITRLIAGIVFMAILAVAAAITVVLEILFEIFSAVWLVLIVGKVRKF